MEPQRAPQLVGGVYPVGDKRCVSLQELEASVPAHILLQFISSVFINKPTVRELIRRHGRTVWGMAASNQTTSSASSSSTTTSSLSSQRKKLSREHHIKMTPVMQLEGASSNIVLDVGAFSTVQILRSLVVCLRPLKAKKAAIEWAEQYTLENDVGDHEKRMIRQWKQQYCALEIKMTVHERRTRLSNSEHKRKEIRSELSKVKRQYFAEGQKLEESLLGRVEFTGVGKNCNSDDAVTRNRSTEYIEEIQYPDDFEPVGE